MDITVRIDGLKEFQAEMAAWPRETHIATSRAIRKTLKWVNTRIKRDAAKDLKVPQKALTGRLKISTVRNGETSGKLWAGTWNISPFNIGNPVQGLSGVTGIRGRRYRGAFLAKIYTVRQNIWIRLHSKHYDPLLYPARSLRRIKKELPAELRGRFPVVKVSIPIEPTMQSVFDRDEEEIQNEFYKKLTHELNYELRVKKSR
jgi:hypothetical protein